MMTLQEEEEEEEEEEALRKKEMGAVVWRSGACSTSTAFCGANKPLWQQLLVLVLMQRLPRLLSRQCSRSHEAVGELRPGRLPLLAASEIGVPVARVAVRIPLTVLPVTTPPSHC
jgi:hypothetical protein